MIVPGIVLLLCGVVVIAGGSAELLDTARQRREPVPVMASGTDAPERTGDTGRWPLSAWFGVAAFTILAAASIAGRDPETSDLTLAVLLLGFAGERAFYLVRRRTSGSRRALGAEILALAVGAVGLLLGATV